ncbi:hypothetical protein [Variovorax paradoxus]|uniref:hypothetical protein n=1 Tax=Variovorax paradoxus TaxID=34073 RepID=UPI00193406DF|nr:hypothetical protein INQ48_12115 [Variovorax paradoxus]
MVKISRIAAISFFALACASSMVAFAESELLPRDIGRGVHISVPREWHSQRALVEMEERIRSVDVGKPGIAGKIGEQVKTKAVLLAVGQFEDRTSPQIKVTSQQPPTITRDYIAGATDESLKALAPRMEDHLKEYVRHLGNTLISVTPMRVVMFGGQRALASESVRTSKYGNVVQRQYIVATPTQTLLFTMVFQEAEAATQRPLFQRVEQSVRVD